eukprot:Protomagalhaensia_sp_Gyna_25__4467@NODE_409_length_3527_cov_145_545298_g315_i0_p3_GENE_NODE_409_length_3527_cov_145_545298_g315_i0NODE_409_length_3527_cov_145_545298_g315_i0_p3_ORF_typecomplete_len248_score27_45RAC_head/PF16717_5/1e03RAC_head/PF16717_5/1_1_NODE_409_length_3527_cov_145_545298_g315_i025003243
MLGRHHQQHTSPHQDKVVFVSLSEDVHFNFEVLVPLLFGDDPLNSRWSSKYYCALLRWQILDLSSDDTVLHVAADDDDDAVLLYVVGVSAQSPVGLAESVLARLSNAVIIRFVESHDQGGEGIVPLDLSLQHDMIESGQPNSKDVANEFWQGQIEQARRPVALARRENEGSPGLERLMEVLDLQEWRHRQAAMRSSAFGEASLASLESLMNEMHSARLAALNGDVSDQDRRDRAEDLVTRLLGMLNT